MVRAKKELGQNWLSDQKSLQAMLDIAKIGPEDNVLEVGPGTGRLTDKLIATKAAVTILEFDSDLLPRLTKMYLGHPNKPTIIEGDIRNFDLGVMPVGYKICANIPYYLTANLMRKLTDESNKPFRAALLVQKEVAEKIVSSKGSMLSTLVSAWYDTNLGPLVPAAFFEPVPSVDSQVLGLSIKESPLLDAVSWPVFVRAVKMGYSSPRKKLRSNIAAGLGTEKVAADRLIEEAGLDVNIRAEQLALEDWLKLMHKL